MKNVAGTMESFWKTTKTFAGATVVGEAEERFRQTEKNERQQIAEADETCAVAGLMRRVLKNNETTKH